jgi:hypothetical protein
MMAMNWGEKIVTSVLNRVLPDSKLILRFAKKKSHDSSSSSRHVLILGWGGSKQRSLAKVAEFYSDRGVNTNCFIMPLGIPCFARLALVKNILNELEAITDQGGDKVSIHLFSNNGAWTFAHLNQLIDARNAQSAKKHKPLPRIDRVVVDSAPHFFYKDLSLLDETRMYTKVLTSIILGKAQYHHVLVSPMLMGALFVLNIFRHALRLVQSLVPAINVVPDYVRLNLYLRDHWPQVPTLFMYSASDFLVQRTEVEDFAQKLKSRLAHDKKEDMIIMHKFAEVGHTAAFFAAGTRDAYRERLSEFMDITQ